MINTAFLVGLSALGLVKGFVLAGFLSTDDYGVWGILAVSFGALLWLKQVGIGDKYIQQDDGDQELAFQRAFTLELLFTTAFCVLLAATLPAFALLYGEQQIVAPGLVAILAVLGGALQTPIWVYYRRMQFVHQRALQAIDPVTAFAVSIALAIAGAGYWALVIGLVAGAWAAAIAAIAFSPFPLRLRFQRGTLKSYFGFSWPLVVSSGGSLVIAQAAVITADAHLGLAAVGVIALATNVTMFADKVDSLVTGALYPAICTVRDRMALLHESFVKSNRLALMCAVPFGAALSLFAADLVHFGIGDRWEPAIVVMQVYGVTAALGHIGFNWDAYFRALGNTRPMAVASVGTMVVSLGAGIPLMLTYDLPGFAAAVALQTAVHVAFRAYYLQRLFQGFDFVRHALRATLPVVPAAATILALRALESAHDRTLEIALGELAVFALVTAVATWWLERGLLREVAGYVAARRAAPAPG